MTINKHDTEGTKPLLNKGEFGYDDHVAGGDVGRVFVGTGSSNIPIAKKAEVDETREVLGTTSNVRYDKKLAALNTIDTVITEGEITVIRFEGDDDATVYYRDVLTWTDGQVTEIKHYFGTSDLVTESASTTLVYTGNALETITYTEV